MFRAIKLAVVTSCLVVVACSGDGNVGAEGACGTDGTFGLVLTIFDDRGCTNSACHGQDAEGAGGQLDLRPEVAYEDLVNVAAISGAYSRVFPGEEELSVLYLKLAAKTDDFALASFNISGSPMPSTGDALNDEELDLVRAWIRAGAPETGFVEGGQTLADCDASIVDVSSHTHKRRRDLHFEGASPSGSSQRKPGHAPFGEGSVSSPLPPRISRPSAGRRPALQPLKNGACPLC